MTWPDSRKKAPNVFFDIDDRTGAPSGSGSVPSSGVKIINSPPHPVMHNEYVTSTLYPFLVEDSLQLGLINPTAGVLWDNPHDNVLLGNLSIPSGSLIETIVYKSYTGQNDEMSLGNLSITAGALIETIVYKSYTGQDDNVSLGNLSITGGTLIETIVYISHTANDIMSLGNLQITGGTLI
jgi:hypothetical protein